MSLSPVRLKRLPEMTAEDEELQILTNVISGGWPETLEFIGTAGMNQGRKQKQTFYSNYVRHSHERPTLHDGDAVRMRLPGENE